MKLNKVLLYLMPLAFCNHAMATLDKYEPADLEQYQKTGICVKCNLSDTSIAYPGNVNIQGSDITQSTLLSYSDINMQDSNFSNVTATDSTLYGTKTDFTDTDFTGAILKGAQFNDDDLTNCNFAGADLKGAFMPGANLTKATISNTQIQELASDCHAIMPDGITHGTKCQQSN